MSGSARRRLALAAAFAALAGFYAATFSLRAITDTNLNSLQTRALVEHGDIDLSRYPEARSFERPDLVARQIVERDGRLSSVYGIGISVVAAPVYALLLPFGASEAALQGTVAVLFVAGSVALLLPALRAVASGPVAAGAAALFAFGTTMWPVASMALFPQGPAVFFECLGLAGLFSRERRWGPALAGAGFGTAAFVRPTTAIPLAAVGALYLVRDRRAAAAYALGAALPVGALLWQNQAFWGSPLAGGYSRHGVGFNAPWPGTLWHLLFGFWRGLFVYSPALLVGAAGAAIAARRPGGRLEGRLLALGVSTLATVLFYSRWTSWHGGINQFGYRLLLEVVPFLVILAAFAVERAPRLRAPFAVLSILSILTTTWGAIPHRFAFDGTLFASGFLDASIGQAWFAFVHHPLPGLARLAGVAALTALLFGLARLGSDPGAGHAPARSVAA